MSLNYPPFSHRPAYRAAYRSPCRSPVSPWSPSALFPAGVDGAFYNPDNLATLFQLSNGTVAVAAIGDPVGYMGDLSGNLNHAIQSTAGSRPLLGIQPKSGVRNLLTYSEAFDNPVWFKSVCTISADAATAPDGTMTADRLIDTVADNEHAAYRQITDIAGTHTHTIYVKKDATDWAFLQTWEGLSYFDILNGIVGTPGAGCTISIVDAVVDFPALGPGSGWWRLIVTTTAAGTEVFLAIGPAIADGDRFYPGDGASGLYIWGAQLERGSTVTAYQYKGIWYDCRTSNAITVNDPNHVRFLAADGVDDYMTIPGSASRFKFMHDGTGGYASIGVMPGITADPGVAYEILASSRNSTFVGTSFRYDGASSANRLQFFVANGTANIVSASTAADTMPPRTVSIVSAQYSETENPDYIIKRNGTVLLSGNDTGTPSSADAGSDYEICQNPSGGGIPLLGGFYGAVIRDGVPSQFQQDQLVQWQMNEIGI